MNKECLKLHNLLEKGKKFNFKEGEEFKNNLLKEYPNFPKNGVYLMFEKNEFGHDGMRVVHVGINTRGSLINRLNRHINGTIKNSIFREHLFRILKSEESVTEYIKDNISFCIIIDTNKEREELKSKIISTISNCESCKPSSDWLRLNSENEKIRKSGLWNIHFVFGEYQLNENDINNIIIGKKII